MSAGRAVVAVVACCMLLRVTSRQLMDGQPGAVAEAVLDGRPAADTLSHLQCAAGAVTVSFNALLHTTACVRWYALLGCLQLALNMGAAWAAAAMRLEEGPPPLHVEALPLLAVALLVGMAVADMAGGDCFG